MTKQAATDSKKAAKDKYQHWQSKPEQFNCQKCNALLLVPPPQEWVCPIAGCGLTNTPDQASCVSCKQKRKAKVMCGVCENITDIPTNNFLNSVRSTKLQTAQGIKTAFSSEKKEEVKEEEEAGEEVPSELPEYEKVERSPSVAETGTYI